MKLASAVAIACAFCASSVANAQSTIQIANAMQTRATVIVTPVGGATPVTFAITNANAVNFTFADEFFNIQVIPADNPNSGFRFLNVNLRDLASRANGRILRLDGDFAPSRNVLVTRRCLLRRRCCWQTVRGERIAVGLIADLNDGTEFKMVSPTMKYSEVMGN